MHNLQNDHLILFKLVTGCFQYFKNYQMGILLFVNTLYVQGVPKHFLWIFRKDRIVFSKTVF